ncbi:TonB-dependent siderophore receptor [uncultured Piscinibacter sp.]|uniref:TonB-dependent siderophore receptor n=1 Tax=uncultured Piscinibacter sp. TaxID=1131835 RepID=UPI00261CAE99|nr:TonB-dependent siderophore receptor [uncultured Piscinibacter sp.]
MARLRRQTRPFDRRTPLALALGLAFNTVHAQTTPTETQLAPVLVQGRATPVVTGAGWGDVPVSLAPLQAAVFGDEQLKDRGARRLSDLTAFDAAVSDAYNTEGYWDYLTVRGFVIDNRFNYRRDGLPINAETSIPLDNKAQVEVLKGTSGLQAGTSAPGGLVNFVVKRPVDEPLRRASLAWREAGSVTAAVDLNQRFGAGGAFGVRVNAAAGRLEPKVRDADGERHLLAVAGDWRLGADTLIEAEVETSRRSQPSVPGFSLLGDNVPAPVDPRTNLNNQAWSLPVVLEGTTASLRWKQRLADGWKFVAHAATQRLTSDDRIAFPFGCFDPEPAPDGTYYADRYCPNGDFDLYDFRSENERRRTDALELSLQGKLRTGAFEHGLSASLLHSRVKNRFERQTFAFSGTGNVDGSVQDLPANPAPNDDSTNRDERSTEISLRDALRLDERSTLWLGLRHTRLQRESVRTDPLDPRETNYRQTFTTPFVAASHAWAPGQLVYASWSRGVESEVAPNRPRYINAGEALPALKSRQAEVGVKGGNDVAEWSAALFEIRRPLFADLGACDADLSCARQADGSQRHRGIDAGVAARLGNWSLRAGAQWLHARVLGVSNPAIDGKAPTNVPARSLKMQADHRVTALPGLTLQGGLLAESGRMVLPDNSARIPGYARVDLGARYDMRLADRAVVWRAGVDNVSDRRAWREAPYQFGHAYLFPLAPRTLRLSVQADL